MAKKEPSQARLLGRVLGRVEKIRGLHEGELRRDGRVSIEADAVVSGDLVAAQVTVRGLVRGRVVAFDLVLESGGQIWGDVWVETLQQKSGGRMRGWVSELTPPFAAVLESGQPIPDYLSTAPPEETAFVSHQTSLEALRAELIDALLARKAIELELAEQIVHTGQSAAAGDKSSQTGLAAAEQRERTLSQALLNMQDHAESLKSQGADLKEALSEMTRRRDDAVASGVKQEDTIKSMSSELDNRQQRIARVLDDLTKANELAGKRQREIDRLTGEMTESGVQTEQRIDDLVGQLVVAQKDIRDRNKLLDDLGNNLVQSQEHVEQQHWELISIREQIEAMEKRDAELREALAAQESAEDALRRQESEILRLKSELDVTLSEYAQDRAEMTEVDRRLEEQTETIALLHARLADEAGARREMGQLEQQLDQSRRLAEAQRDLAETRAQTLANLQVERDRLGRQQRQLEIKLSSAGELEEGLSGAQERIGELEMDLQASRDQVLAVKKEGELKAEQFRNVRTAGRAQMVKLQTKLDQEQINYAQVQEQMAAWRAESERPGQELATVLAKSEELQTELNMARSIIAELNSDIADLEDRLDERDQTVAKLYVELAEALPESQAAGELQAACQKQAAQIATLESELAGERKEAQDREGQLAQLVALAGRSGALIDWKSASDRSDTDISALDTDSSTGA